MFNYGQYLICKKFHLRKLSIFVSIVAKLKYPRSHSQHKFSGFQQHRHSLTICLSCILSHLLMPSSCKFLLFGTVPPPPAGHRVIVEWWNPINSCNTLNLWLIVETLILFHRKTWTANYVTLRNLFSPLQAPKSTGCFILCAWVLLVRQMTFQVN